MANCGKDILIKREGTEQQQRLIDALSPEYFKLNEFSLNDWMKFAYGFAEHVNYFDTDDYQNRSGNWQDFFTPEKGLEDFLKAFDLDDNVNSPESQNITPHLALFISFIKLLEISQNRFNRLTKKHLDFYYSQILDIQKLPATPDKVHLIFELAKNVLDAKIAENTELDGGKDAIGKKRIYQTSEELIANQIKVSQLKSVYNDHGHSKIKAAASANSYDGAGTEFPGGEIKWWPFGYYEDKAELKASGKEPTYPELTDARLGFAVSAEILELQEGERNIQLTVEFSSALNAISFNQLRDNIEISCSGEKKWLGPFQLQQQISDPDGKTIFTTGLDSTNKILKLAFQVPKDEKAVVGYNSAVLGEHFSTALPVCRMLIKTGNTDGHSLYRNLVEKPVKNIMVNIDVRGVKSLLLESDIGTLNAAKPFYPFGTQPVKKSNFYINYPEVFKKDWKNLAVSIDWKNTPDSFKELYYAYRESYRYKVTPTVFLEKMGDFSTIQAEVAQAKISNLMEEKIAATDLISEAVSKIYKVNELGLIVANDSYFSADVEVLNKEEWELAINNLTLFTKDGDLYQTNFSVTNSGYEADKNGPVRLSLSQSFLHELFPRIYALAFSSQEKGALIPNEPYTPMAENVSLDYTAQTSAIIGNTTQNYSDNPIRVFHEHPFGQSEEHPYLKASVGFLATENQNLNLVPTYCKGGELYIGLENAQNLQQVSMLVQVLEGSENPLADSFTGKQKVEWSVLCQNEWESLDSNDMISNETDNFLKSGIVKFSIPKEATTDNTRLPENLVWVKAKINKTYDAVCKTIDILAQAVQSEFTNNGNDLSHLEKGLQAKTISKMIERLATVKSVSQPFNSFGGQPVESDEAYYRRVSERLRHKNRAIALWDYEHIILQEFPSLHKVKCLTHSSETSFLAPGNVLLVVIPDIVNKNVFDIYQPRVSKATLNAVQNHVSRLNSLHVTARVINPDYEEVTVDLKVKFNFGFDESYYLRVLNDDITRFLSPWAFESTADIQFGVTLHRSIVINYIEKLNYVDYVEDVKLIKGGEVSLTSVTPSSPKAILVSAKQHNLSITTKSCKVTTETVEKCQT
jgi:hypothetical protein